MLSLPPVGELENICAGMPGGLQRGEIRLAHAAPSPVTLIQLSMKTACICATTGPSICGNGCRASGPGPAHRPVHCGAMPTPPVNPTRPSTTSSLRWVRLFRRPRCDQWGGWKRDLDTGLLHAVEQLSSIFTLPTQSSSTWTLTPAARSLGQGVGKCSRPMSPDQ
jgi:hypothetical protein